MSYSPFIESLSKGHFKRNILESALLGTGINQEQLFAYARKNRDEYFPQAKVEVRSVIELSNVCHQNCSFCNIHIHAKLKRYTISYTQFIQTIEYLYLKGRRVILLQSGENRSPQYIDYASKCIHQAKNKFDNLTFILCMGNLNYKQYKQLKDAGADRYILKFETSNPGLYQQIKPSDSLQKRIDCINILNDLGFEVGSGNIVGLPGQTVQNLVDDLLFINQLKLTMVSTSAFIPAENSNYSNEPPGDLNITLNYMALMRIRYPKMLIPSTSSLEKVKPGGQYLGLRAGANTVTIHDGTPQHLKKYFPIYSTKRFIPSEKHIKKIIAKADLVIELKPQMNTD